jgi:hypothetical protein
LGSVGHKVISLRHSPSPPSVYSDPAKNQSSSTLEANGFPCYRPIPTAHRAGRAVHTYPPSHHPLDYPHRLHNLDHPSTLIHYPSPISTMCDTEVTSSPEEVAEPIALGPVTAQPSLAAWNARLATSRMPPCSHTGRDNPKQPELPGALHPS